MFPKLLKFIISDIHNAISSPIKEKFYVEKSTVYSSTPNVTLVGVICHCCHAMGATNQKIDVGKNKYWYFLSNC